MASKRKISETGPSGLQLSILKFLKSEGLKETLAAFTKEAKLEKASFADAVDLNSVFPKTAAAAPAAPASAKKAKVESSSSSSSSSDSSSDSESEDEKKPTPAPAAGSKKMESDSSSSDSSSDSDSDSEDEKPAAKKPTPAPAAKATPAKAAPAKAAASSSSSSSSSSDSSSDSDSDDEKKPAAKPVAKAAATPAKTPVKKADSSSDSSSSSSSDSSDDEEEPVVVKKTPAKAAATPATTPAKVAFTPGAVGGVHKAFVKGLPWAATQEEVADFFKSCGTGFEVEMVVGEDGRPAGTSFVKFAERAHLDAALALDGQYWPGTERWLKIVESDKNARFGATSGAVGERPEGCDTVFVGNLPWDVDEEGMRGVFAAAGEISSVRFATGEDGSFRGFGHVSFYNGEDTLNAVKLAGTQINGRAIRVDFAPPRNRDSAKSPAGRGRGEGRGEGRGGRGTPGRGGRGAPGGFSPRGNSSFGSAPSSSNKKMTFDE